jgi:hypothetical protein
MVTKVDLLILRVKGYNRESFIPEVCDLVCLVDGINVTNHMMKAFFLFFWCHFIGDNIKTLVNLKQYIKEC